MIDDMMNQTCAYNISVSASAVVDIDIRPADIVGGSRGWVMKGPTGLAFSQQHLPLSEQTRSID